MKTKRLTIIFFSITMLAATPRAMSHFSDYADALHQKAEAEWLNFLLGFATPTEIEKNAATSQNAQQPVVCTKGMSKDTEPATVKSPTKAKAPPRSFVSKKLSFEYTLTNALSASTDSSKESAPDGFHLDRNTRGRVVHTLGLPVDQVAAYGDGGSKAEHLWTLTQSTLSGKRKAARALVRELNALITAKSQSVTIVPVRFEKDIAQPSESEPDIANQETDNGHVSSVGSMR